MTKTTKIILGITLTIWGIYSIYRGVKGKSLAGVMMPSDTYLSRKIFGEKGSNKFWNLFWGIIEVIFGVLILLGKFD